MKILKWGLYFFVEIIRLSVMYLVTVSHRNTEYNIALESHWEPVNDNASLESGKHVATTRGSERWKISRFYTFSRIQPN